MNEATHIAATTHRMRQLLAVAGTLVVIIGLPLYLVPQNSDQYFSWRVRTDLSATFLGASYLAAAVIEFRAARERAWANARIAVPAVLMFTLLTMLVTLTNSNQYNYGASGFVQSAGTWAWTAVYVGVPPLMAVILWIQLQHPGGDPHRVRAVAPPVRAGLAAGGLALGLLGALMLLSPGAASWIWPWRVTDLTARSFGAWLVGFGVVLAHMAWESDWRRVQPACEGAAVLGGLQLVALVRYPDVPSWGAPQTWVYVALLVGFVGLGLYGWRVGHRTRSPATKPGPASS